MALVVTPGASDADSYLSVEDADALAEKTIGAEASGWLDADDLATKEMALTTATRDINAYLRTGFEPYATDQALRFPRSTDLDADDEPVIPKDIELATFYQAIYLLKNHAVMTQANTRRARGMRSASEPNMSYSESDEQTASDRMAPAALLHLEGFATVPGATRSGGLRSVRVSSGFVGY